jgi:hypothetical protein
MNKIACGLVLALLLVLSSLSCVKAPVSSPAASPTITTQKTVSATSKATPTVTTVAVTTPLARPSAGKVQEFTFPLKSPANIYNLVIYLGSGEKLDLDWKFVSTPQSGINFMIATPEGRELNSKLQLINLLGHPLYDQNLPSQTQETAVGNNVVFQIGKDKYCNEGYYSLIFSASPSQAGTVYLRYSLTLAE